MFRDSCTFFKLISLKPLFSRHRFKLVKAGSFSCSVCDVGVSGRAVSQKALDLSWVVIDCGK